MASCVSREEAIIDSGGKPPLACTNLKKYFSACKDSRKSIFLCSNEGFVTECVSVPSMLYIFNQVEL